MGFFTEMFSRPRPSQVGRMSATAIVVGTSGHMRRIDDVCRPADFPRVVRSLKPA
jgi:hypothetical protein